MGFIRRLADFFQHRIKGGFPEREEAAGVLSPSPVPEDLAVRLPAWVAISELWRNTKLRRFDLRYIAKALAHSPYDWPEIEAIMIYEVAPAVHENLRRPSGTSESFDSDWLQKAVREQMGRPDYREISESDRCYMTELVADDWCRIQHIYDEIKGQA